MDLPPGEGEAWTAKLRERLEAKGLRTAAPPGPGTVRLSIAVRVESGAGETDRGARFEAAVAGAEVVVGRLRIPFRSRPGVAPTAAEARRAAMADLLERLVAGFAW